MGPICRRWFPSRTYPILSLRRGPARQCRTVPLARMLVHLRRGLALSAHLPHEPPLTSVHARREPRPRRLPTRPTPF
jgi:hypothetical protein